MQSPYVTLLLFSLVLLLLSVSNAFSLPSFPHFASRQANMTQGPRTLAETLTVVFFPTVNAAGTSLFPPTIAGAQTPILVHYTFSTAIAGYEMYAACDHIALSFFGFKHDIADHLCTDADLKATTHFLSFYYVLALSFPEQSTASRKILVDAGVNPHVNTTDISTPQGFATRVARRIARFIAGQGWNSQGERRGSLGQISGMYPRKYVDYTGYTPRNPAHLRPEDLRYPLRWQPLTQAVDGKFGDYTSQLHIVPHIGRVVRPLSMSSEEWESISGTGPYRRPNAYKSISLADESSLTDTFIPEMLREMRSVTTDLDVFLSYWWDNKLVSIGFFGIYYEYVLGVPVTNSFFTGLGENMALYDAVLMAWREKRRHDLIRPGPLIRRLFAGRTVETWRGVNKTAGPLPAEEWQPIIRTMPHSEFPSASAVMCAALIEFVKLQLDRKFGSNFTDPGFTIPFPKGSFPTWPVTGGVTVQFDTLDQAARDCGMSRARSGLHFKPAVEEGLRLGKEVGKRTFETWRDIQEGRVPKHCHWCVEQ